MSSRPRGIASPYSLSQLSSFSTARGSLRSGGSTSFGNSRSARSLPGSRRSVSSRGGTRKRSTKKKGGKPPAGHRSEAPDGLGPLSYDVTIWNPRTSTEEELIVIRHIMLRDKLLEDMRALTRVVEDRRMPDVPEKILHMLRQVRIATVEAVDHIEQWRRRFVSDLSSLFTVLLVVTSSSYNVLMFSQIQHVWVCNDIDIYRSLIEALHGTGTTTCWHCQPA